MKVLTAMCVSILVAFLLMSVLPLNGEEEVYADMIRLHVLAHSDEEDEQLLKLKVRDAILAKVSEITSEINEKNEALSVVESSLGELSELGEMVVREMGYEHKVTAELGNEVYPEREYDGFKLPAGEYCSLRIKIGDAEGKNWWCVLFPPLCTTAAEDREEVFVSTGFTGDQYKVVTETESSKYRIKFKILEILEELMRDVCNDKK